jgi:uncharacterized membrane protein (DUF4010 family)
MLTTEGPAFRLATALAIGLLMGAERERRKGEGPGRSPAGIRTFAVAALLGGVSYRLGSEVLLAVTTLALAGFCVVAYWRAHDEDPGLTSEIALLLAALLGGLAQREIAIASGMAVVVTILLAARTPLHHFVRAVLSEQEVIDALIFVAAVLVVLPLTPNRYLGPYGAINPRTIWKIVILMISISAGGYIAVRLVGARFGLPIAGFASGFVSSTATIGAMGERAAHEPALVRPAVAGAVLSNVATVIGMALVLAATSPPVLSLLRVPLAAAGIAAIAYGALLTFLSVRYPVPQRSYPGRAFSLKTALVLGGTIAVVLLLSAALNAWFGKRGVLAAAAVAGFADTHSAAVSVASLVAANKMTAREAMVPILAGLTTNTVSKVVFASVAGGRRFAAQVIPGLVLMIAAAWIGLAFLLGR